MILYASFGSLVLLKTPEKANIIIESMASTDIQGKHKRT